MYTCMYIQLRNHMYMHMYMHMCHTHMYMYTKYGDGKPYDVFKHKITRKHETVDVEPDA